MRVAGTRIRIGLIPVVPALLTLGFLSVPVIAEKPDDYDGLAAWYRIDSLHRNHNDGDLVAEWPDSSGQGHRLVARSDGARAVFQTRQLNLEPVVQIRANTAFAVERPFELQDHTIFIVVSAQLTRRALFHDDQEDRRGLVLFDEQRFHRYAMEDPEETVSYSGEPTPPKQFGITMLARGEGLLSCQVNGVDISSGSRLDQTIRVGGFFFVRPVRGGRGDADGLRVAEMIFYDRRLNDEEIAGVTAYLSSKFALEVTAPELESGSSVSAAPVESGFLPQKEDARVWLGTQHEPNVNPQAVVLFWQTQVKLEPPFHHDPGEETGTRLVCTQDGVRAELFVQLPLRSTEIDTRVQVLLLKNGEEYLDVYGDSGPIREGRPLRATVEFKTTLDLNAGDSIEIVVRGIGENGMVILEPYNAALVVRVD